MALNDIGTDGWYTIECGNVIYTLPVRYQEVSRIGQGAFGAVIRAKDTLTNRNVAIKKMLKPFETRVHAKRTYRELKLLMHLNHPDAQVVQLVNVFTPDQTLETFENIYFVFNYVDYDLHKVIRRRIPFTEEHIKLIVYSLLRGIKFIHSANVFHRDLKPQNIGIDKNSNITIFDFGLARHVSNTEFTTYVATRWWRAPDVYTNERNYNKKLDIWSIGCIMGELIALEPLFRGADAVDQLNKIFDIIGTPDANTLTEICTPAAASIISQMNPRPKKDFRELFGYKYDPNTNEIISGVSEDGIDLIDRLLSFDHRQRPTAEQALEHPFLQQYHNPLEEPIMEPLVDEHESQAYNKALWKSIIWHMIQDFVQPSWVSDDQFMDE